MRDSRLPTIVQYMSDQVDNSKSWSEGNHPCPFHKEEHGKSFSIKGSRWRCFGQCQCGGDVIDLHRFNYKIKDRAEAEKSLFYLYHIDVTKGVSFERKEVNPDEVETRRRLAYNKALRRANDPDSWLELDYILSKVPFEVTELEVFCDAHEPS